MSDGGALPRSTRTDGRCNMNFIPKQATANGNYMCTWDLQHDLACKLHLQGENGSDTRDALTPEWLFGTEEHYHPLAREYRSGMYFLLDDGWDVPRGSRNLGGDSTILFGAVDPDPGRFAIAGDTPVERLSWVSRKAKEFGYAGAGLWIAPQMSGCPAAEGWNETQTRSYWEERAAWCHEAGIAYWKVDWGYFCGSPEYRRIMTEAAHRRAPGLAVEHALVQMPMHLPGEREGRRAQSRSIFRYSDFFRTYDVIWPMSEVCTLARIHDVLTDAEPLECGCKGILNVEYMAGIAAGLGCSMGVMHADFPIHAVLRWQRLAPPFGAAEAGYLFSAEQLDDFYYFAKKSIRWVPYDDMELHETAPAVMSRGCALPQVISAGADAPFVLASRNPHTGAYAVSTLRRVLYPNVGLACMAHVTLDVDEPGAFVGVFGLFESLTLRYAQPLPSGARVWAQNLMEDEAQDVTEQVVMQGDSIRLPGRLLARIGACNYACSVPVGAPISDPALLIKLVF